MLSRVNRLPKEDISHVLRRGTHTRNDFIEFIFIKTQGPPRFCFVVSTKIDTRATRRNRMRRTMSESIRHLLPHLPTVDGICVAKKNFADMQQADVEKNIVSLLNI